MLDALPLLMLEHPHWLTTTPPAHQRLLLFAWTSKPVFLGGASDETTLAELTADVTHEHLLVFDRDLGEFVALDPQTRHPRRQRFLPVSASEEDLLRLIGVPVA